jgi:hypothetical protein
MSFISKLYKYKSKKYTNGKSQFYKWTL